MSVWENALLRRREFGTLVKRFRLDKGVNIHNVIDTGVIQRVIDSVENGSSNYTIDSLFAYLNACSVSLCFIESNRVNGVNDKIELANYCKGMREQKEFKRYHLRKLGFSQYLIQSIENGSSNYTIDSLLSYCKGLGVTVSLL